MISRVALDPAMGEPSTIEGVFIRAPKIRAHDSDVEVLGRWQQDPVLVRQGTIVGATFHPELTGDRRIHELFLTQEEVGHV